MSASSLLGVVLTLGFVLGLLAVVVRLLRRFALGNGGGRGRLPLEVVQRLSLGPKQGIAVVRVGERLLVVSLGEGGVRPLVELGDAERALLAAPAATVAAPVASPVAAPAGIAAAQGAPRRRAALLSPLPPVAVVAAESAGVAAEPAPPVVHRADDFRTLLRGALVGATGAVRGRAAALLPLVAAGVLALGAAEARAQAPAAGPAAAQAAPAPAPAAPLPGVVGARAQDSRIAPPPPRATQVAVPGQPAAGTEPPALARVDTMVQRLAPQMDLRVGDAEGGLRLSGTVGIVIMMGLLTLLPTLLLMMTGFTRILIVLHFLRQAMGTQSAPPAHLVAGLALLLTGFVMTPTLQEVNERAVTPWLDGRMEQAEMLKEGVKPFRAFMLEQTRDSDIQAFLDMSDSPPPAAVEDVPLVVLVSAFVTSELRTAFQIGFALFLPFIVIDVVVASVLMSMGMFMLPPAMISLPFKLLLFVLVDGWTLLTQSLVASFR